MALENGRVALSFGVMGGQYQAVGHAHLLSNLWDFGLHLQRVVDLPRVFARPDGPVIRERGVPDSVAAGLARLGHAVEHSIGPIGGAQAIMIDQAGVLIGASDSRKDGCALGL
jgi:gamma-glutamyltranspeptidase/glutathione hydrolase